MNENMNIHCDVKECRHHSQNQDYCTLNEINVIKHATKADCPECTDCGSFEVK